MGRFVGGGVERKRGGERIKNKFFLPAGQQLHVILCKSSFKGFIVQLLSGLFNSHYRKLKEITLILIK